jgi:formate dehydrogenase subunit gamma
MMITGAILMWPSLVTVVIPGYVVPAAKAAHGAEALLALLAILIWHFYGTHFAKGKMPLDRSMITGKVPLDVMNHEHPRELEAAERARLRSK